ncbi:MAG: SDR family NAD(P)-dependent oxidoreductase [Deltaproteobacteria bacterium]|nr:SDR family NAD(P)-dependent oxidoreductase [Deltaproteobacteria bacterium]
MNASASEDRFMNDWLRDVFHDRPVWINALMVFSAYMAFVYMPWDIFWKPVSHDEEVWFGILFTGWSAKLGALAHWFVYAAATYGFRRRRPWMRIWGPLYSAQVAFGMLVWNVLYWGSWTGWIVGLIGALPFAALTLALFGAHEYFRDPRPHLRERYGDWALVTGATAGIGAELARSLARRGVSCVITGRREERLRELASELEQRHGVSTRCVPVDLAESGGAERLADACRDLDIAILVNNAGVGYVGRFDKQDTGRLRDLVEVNCSAPVVLTSKLLPAMLERGRGAVIITGSVAGRQPLPLHGVYAATKGFDLLFGEALYVELRGTGVDVLVLEPGVTDTEFQEVSGQIPHGGATAHAVAEAGIEALGDQPSLVFGWIQWIRANAAARLVSRPLVAYIAREITRPSTPAELR